MKYKLLLTKGMSYHGIVSATKKNPIVEVDNKKIADAAVKTGYFKLIESEKTELSEMNITELKSYAEEKGIDVSNASTKEDIRSLIEAFEQQ